MPDLKISELPQVGATALAASDPLPLADLSASETKKVTIKDLLQGGFNFVDDASIPGSKVDYAIPAGSIGTAELADRSVTAIKLADNSTVLVQATIPATGTYVGQLLLDTDDDKIYTWNGSAWVAVKAAGSINSIVSGANDVLELTIVITADEATIIPAFKPATGAKQFAAGPTGVGGAVSMRPIAPGDLPPGTNTTLGAVSTPIGGGLRIEDPSSVGQNANAVIDNDVASSLSETHLVTYSDKGLVLSGRPIQSLDLPQATAGSGGIIKAGTEFTVDPSGILKHANQVVASTFTKVTYDGQGHIISGVNLDEADIPPLDAKILTTGTLDVARIGTADITRDKLADYAISYIQEAAPPTEAAHHIGCLWYQESSAQLRMFNGNSFRPVGFGRLSEENLRFCGTADAATGTVLDITPFGSAAGLTPDTPIPAATDALTGAYLVVQVAGTYEGNAYDAGDWILCLGEAQGWDRIDTLSGGGGGSTLLKLGDLLDVNITSPQLGDTIIFDPITNKWLNRSTSAKKTTFLQPFDGIRTSFTMTTDAGTANDILMSIGGILQEPGKDFTFTAARTINFSSAPSTNLNYWIVIEGVPSTGGGGGGGGTTLPPGTAADEILTWDNSLTSWVPSATLDGGSF